MTDIPQPAQGIFIGVIMENEFAPPLTGEILLTRLDEKVEREIIAEGFLYELTTLMISADPGAGKSTILTQVAVELAAGLPVFGYFHVPKPVKVLYIQTERNILELLERLQVISKTYPIKTKEVSENLMITDEYQKLNLLNPTHADTFINCIKRDSSDAKVIFIDPIYSTVAGGLSSDIPASAFTRVMNRLQKELKCCMGYSHHTTKDSYNKDGVKIDKDDPFYGSQWLKAHITGSYNMKNTEVGVTLFKKKDNYRILSPKIALEYDAETELCSVIEQKLGSLDRIKNFVRIKQLDQKTFDFNQMQAQTELCTRTLRKLMVHRSIKDLFKVVSTYRNKNLYKIEPEKI